MDYTILLPAYNEAARLPSLLQKLKGLNAPIIVVDDGSSDDTASIAQKFGARLIQHEANLGKGAAVRTGLAAANSKYIVLLDADNQHSPDEIPKLVAKLADYDFVNGSRFISSPKNIPAYRYWANRIIQAAFWLHGKRLTDPLSGFRAFRREPFLRLKQDDFRIDLEILLTAMRDNLRITEVPISVAYTGNAQGKFSNPLTSTAIGEFIRLLAYAASG